MPTIEELFRSKKLSSGKTAEEQYSVRNSKDNELTSAAGLMKLPFKAATAIRRKISTTGSETRVEQETTGLRIISKLSSPIIYGTKIGRFTLQQSDDVQEMKNSTNPNGGGNGLLGGLVNSVRGTINSVKSILGFPQNITPTKIYLNKTQFNSKDVKVSETINILGKIKEKSGGGLIGKLLSNNLTGTIGQSANNIPGAAAEAGKKALKNLLLGSGQAGQINLANSVCELHNIYATDRHGNITNGILFVSQMQQSSNLPDSKYSDVVKRYATTSGRNDLSTKFSSIPDASNFNEKKVIDKILIDKEKGIIYPGKYTKFQKKRFDKYSLSSKLGLNTNEDNTTGKNKDVLNKLTVYEPDASGIGKDPGTLKSYDDLDLVALKFYSIGKNRTVQFRATITGLTETYSPTWDTSKFIGNPFNFYTYSGIERSIQFNFKVYSLSVEEHIAAWQRLDFLASLVYADYGGIGSNYTIPPFLKFTLGDMFKNKECFIDSLIYTIDDNNVWETGIPAQTIANAGPNVVEKTSPAVNYKLPRIVDVGITLKFVEKRAQTYYAYSAAPKEEQKKENKDLPEVVVSSNKNSKTAESKAVESKSDANKKLNEKLNEKAAAGLKMSSFDENDGIGSKIYILDGQIVPKKVLEEAAGIGGVNGTSLF
jgi:hypothetical protein